MRKLPVLGISVDEGLARLRNLASHEFDVALAGLFNGCLKSGLPNFVEPSNRGRIAQSCARVHFLAKRLPRPIASQPLLGIVVFEGDGHFVILRDAVTHLSAFVPADAAMGSPLLMIHLAR